jgi:integrase
MARRPVSVFRRPTTKKGQYRYYVKLWNEASRHYTTARSASSLVAELGLDLKAFPPTSRTGAILIGEELRKRGGIVDRKGSPLLVEYLADFWNWDTSAYVQGKLARGQRIGRQYVIDNAARVKNHIRAAFPVLRLSAVRPYHLEEYLLRLKKESGLSNRTVNAIIEAIAVPMREASRLGLIESDPSARLQLLGRDTCEKGIPTEGEIRALVTVPGLDPRIRCAILLGSACALRLGEIQALRAGDIGETTLTIGASWGKYEGLKSTKTGRVRVVPLPRMVKDALLALDASNIHGPGHFLMYGADPDAPLNAPALERMFRAALRKIGIDEDTRRARSLSFHSLRHWSNATLRGSVSDAKLRLLTGHSTEAMTDHYDHATEADLAELSKAQEVRILPFLAVSGA